MSICCGSSSRVDINLPGQSSTSEQTEECSTKERSVTERGSKSVSSAREHNSLEDNGQVISHECQMANESASAATTTASGTGIPKRHSC